MKTGMILSLVANIALVISLGIVSRSTNKKVAAAVDESTKADLKECAQAVKTVVKIGYLGGCMTAITEAKQVQQGDPLIPVYMDYCLQGAQSMAEKVEMK